MYIINRILYKIGAIERKYYLTVHRRTGHITSVYENLASALKSAKYRQHALFDKDISEYPDIRITDNLGNMYSQYGGHIINPATRLPI